MPLGMLADAIVVGKPSRGCADIRRTARILFCYLTLSFASWRRIGMADDP
jgi:hypothetical protein